jgi:hypothetical protein
MRYTQLHSPAYVSIFRRPHVAPWHVGFALLVIVLIGLGNPLACFIHCWGHVHSTAATTAAAPDHAHMHHDMAHAAMSMSQTGATNQPAPSSSSVVDCLNHHETPSPLTVAVLLPLLLVAITRVPTLPLRLHSLFLRLVTPPPPRHPPRLRWA